MKCHIVDNLARSLSSTLFLFLRVHDIRPHGQLSPLHHIIARMYEIVVLKYEHTTNFRHYIESLLHVVGMEGGRTAL